MVRLNMWQKKFVFVLFPLLLSVIVYILLTSIPAVSKFILRASANNRPESGIGAVLNIVALYWALAAFVGLILYVYISYRLHARPLKLEDPYAPYTIRHHTQLVILPLVRYKKKQIGIAITYPLVTVLAITVGLGLSLQKVLALAPTVTTGSANEITQTSVRLAGNVTSQGSQNLTVRGFEYGPTTSYGQVASDTKPDTYQFASSFGTGGSGNGQFSQPAGIAKDSAGNIYVVDYNNHRVQKFNAYGVYQSQWGSFGIFGGSYSFNFPQGIAIDENDMIYVTDTSSSRVQKYDTNGVYQATIGAFGAGDGQLNNPLGIASDKSGNIYVADGGNQRISVYTTAGTFVRAFGWGVDTGANAFQTCTSGCQSGISGNGNGQLSDPYGVTVDQNGKIYVTNRGVGHNVTRYNSDITFDRKWGSLGSGEQQMHNPSGISHDNFGFIYVTDNQNHRIKKYYDNGVFVMNYGSNGSSSGQFSYPTALFTDNVGGVFVADNGNNRVVKITPTVSTGSYSLVASGLTCNTTYHYRAYSENVGEVGTGTDATFTTAPCYAPNEFVTTWKTDNPGASANNQVSIFTNGGGYNYTIDWGDATSDTGVTGNITHTYAAPGTYTVKISGSFPKIMFGNGGDCQKILSVDQWGTSQWQYLQNAFNGCSNMVLKAGDIPDLSQVTSLGYMFFQSQVNSNLNDWDISSITSTLNMFGETPFNQDLSGWDTSSITDMRYMFGNASDFNGDVSNWNTGSAVQMEGVFAGSAFNKPLDDWDTSSATSMRYMFAVNNAFNQPLAAWDTSQVIDMSQMFYLATSFNQPIDSWDTGNVTDMSNMFSQASAFDQPLGSWTTANVTNMDYMFAGASAFNQDISSWNTAGVISFDRMFFGASAFNQPLNNWVTSSVQQMGGMFYNASAFNQPLNNWDTGSVVDMWDMFAQASLFDQSLEDWDVTNVTTMLDMLNGSGLSKANYDATLIGWSAQSLQNGVVLGASNLNYCDATTERAAIISNFGWTINDAGQACDNPTLTTQAATSVTETTATLNATITNGGTSNVTERGFQYGPTTSYGQTLTQTAGAPYSTGTFTGSISSLTCGTTYHFRSYATNTTGTSYGEDVSFTANACRAPSMSTQAATSVTETTATLNGTITDTGSSSVTERGFEYGPTTSYGQTVAQTAGAPYSTGTFTGSISSLTCGTTYHFRSYSINSTGTAYGTDVSLATTACQPPAATTQAATSVTVSGGILNGSITDLGSNNVSSRGFQYGPTTSYGQTLTQTSGTPYSTGSFAGAISSLSCGTTYYFRAFATNTTGTGHGAGQSFTTGSCQPPTLTTQAATSVTETTATLNATITNGGTSNVTERGFQYGPTTSYGQTLTQTAGAPYSTGTFTGSISSLTCGTTYHFRSYATNTTGTSYGEDVTVGTNPCPTPTLAAPVQPSTNSPPLNGSKPEVKINVVFVDEKGQQVTSYQVGQKWYAQISYATQSGTVRQNSHTITINELSDNLGAVQDLWLEGAQGDVLQKVTEQWNENSISDLPWSKPGTYVMTLGCGVIDFYSANFVNKKQCGYPSASDTENTEKALTYRQISGTVSRSGDLVLGLTISSNSDYATGNWAVSSNETVARAQSYIQASSGGGSTSPGENRRSGGGFFQTIGLVGAIEAFQAAVQREGAIGVLGDVIVVAPKVFRSLLLPLAALYLIAALLDYYQTRRQKRTLNKIKTTKDLYDQFIVVGLHFLNTPLTIIKGARELAKTSIPDAKLLTFDREALELEQVIRDVQNSNNKSYEDAGDVLKTANTSQNLNIVWQILIAIAVSIVSLDLALRLTHAYSTPTGQKMSNIVLGILLCLLVIIGHKTIQKRAQIHKLLKQLAQAEQDLLNRKTNMLTTASGTIYTATKSLSEAAAVFKATPSEKLINNGLGMLSSFVLQLQNLARFSENKKQDQVTNITSVVKSAIEAVQGKTEQKSLQVINGVNGQLYTSLSQDELSLVVGSIIGNAVEYNIDRGEINIQAKVRSKGTVLTIKDSGQGIDNSRMAGLYQPFSRGVAAEDFTSQGLGLSLFVVKTILHNAGGTIRIQSELHKGTTVTVVLPKTSVKLQGQQTHLVTPTQ